MKPPTCCGCPLNTLGVGFLHPEAGRRRVVLVGEALGEAEAATAAAFVGRAGRTAQDLLQRAGYERADFGWVNAVWCRPPENVLEHAPYETAAMEHCWRHHGRPWIESQHPIVVVPLGNIPLAAFTGSKGIAARRGYPEWLPSWNAWMVPTFHPSHIQRGKPELGTVFIHDIRKAVAIAEAGRWVPASPRYVIDPTPSEALRLAQAYRATDALLAYDIETTRKGEDEEELDEHEEDTIIRIGFGWTPYEAITFPWAPAYVPAIREFLGGPGTKVAWNMRFDNTRVEAAGIRIGGCVRDGMVAWHVLHSDLPRGLGFAATFLCPDQPRWKHLSSTAPGYYNACDVDVTLRGFLRTVEALRGAGLWDVYERQILALDPIKAAMSAAGMPRDPERTRYASQAITAQHEEAYAAVAAVGATKVIRWHPKFGYVRAPKVYEGLEQVEFAAPIRICAGCGAENVTKAHIGPKKPCAGAEIRTIRRPVTRWARRLPFVPSPAQVTAYIRASGHRAVGWKGSATTDEAAVRGLALRHPADPFYPLLLQQRKLQKFGGTYIGWFKDGQVQGGLPVGPDGRVHPTFTDTPSTLRWACQDPNMQNIPRADTALGKLVRQTFVAPVGSVFWSIDFKGIEAVLVGYFAGDRRYTWLARHDVHSFVTAHVLALEGVFTAADVPDLTWEDTRLLDALAQIKRAHGVRRTVVKRLVHGGNYLLGVRTAQGILFKDLGIIAQIADIRRIYGLYYELFPKIRAWQWNLCRQVDGSRDADVAVEGAGVSYVRNPFGFVHRFHQAVQWEQVGGKWQGSFGPGAAQVVAFPAQSTAAAIGKAALVALPDETRATLRLYIHDEFVGEAREGDVAHHVRVARDIMERPIPELPLDPAWAMGAALTLDTEAKVGRCWGEMEGV